MSLFSKLFKCQVKNELPVVNSKENEIEKVSPAIELSGAEYNVKDEIKHKNYVKPSFDFIKNNELKRNLSNVPKDGIINIPLGKVNGNMVYVDFTKLPNLLIGGTVMSGKTNLINSIVCNIILNYVPDEVRLLIADSKGVDYSCYNGIPHLLCPVIRNPNELNFALNYEISEMKYRYDILEKSRLKKLSDYNALGNKLPYHIIIIDDYTIFANETQNNLNSLIEDLARSGWNVGIHLVLVVNYPTRNVLSAISLLNFPSRISFRVPSIRDSKMILALSGAEKIKEVGNFIVNSPIVVQNRNMHIDLLEDNDIVNVLNLIKSQNKPDYIDMSKYIKKMNEQISYDVYNDSLYDDIVEFVISTQKVSASLLQRKFKLGYNRAARTIDLLEERGIIGPPNGSNSRDVLVRKDN
ncbi:MAG: FtsK/SpoIIIE domain-containing protein [Bacilli bacterium]|jgi:Ftsk/SpoIIIE family protein|nr:FtsK/SpoIIIE domain-containing protein [Bacilli bacterium]DAS82782.1 MAG TPA: DNA TRANSLOCASE FTSK [Caudoviricetes sp.]